MRESVIYQDIWTRARTEGREEGKQEGREEGKQEGEVSLVLRQIHRRIGQVSLALEAQIRGLSVQQLEDLGEALLDFTNEGDLVNWLQNQAR